MMTIWILGKVSSFPFDGYTKVAMFDNVDFISAERHNDIDYFCLNLKDGKTATFNAVDYIMFFV